MDDCLYDQSWTRDKMMRLCLDDVIEIMLIMQCNTLLVFHQI